MVTRRRATPPEEPTASAAGVALALLARRDYTIQELTDRLQARGYGLEAIVPVIDRFVANGMLDDRRVAAAFVRTASHVKGRGPLRIRRELEARGVAPAIVRDLFAARSRDDDAEALARAIARLRLPARLDEAARRRVFGRLLRRGFAPGAIAKALRARGITDPSTDD